MEAFNQGGDEQFADLGCPSHSSQLKGDEQFGLLSSPHACCSLPSPASLNVKTQKNLGGGGLVESSPTIFGTKMAEKDAKNEELRRFSGELPECLQEPAPETLEYGGC